MSHNIAQRSAIAFGWSLAGSGGKAVAQLVIQIALARMLSPHEFGQYSATLIVLGIGWLLADGGFGAALVQKRTLAKSDIEQALGSVLAVAAVVAALIWVSAPLVAAQFSDASLAPMLRVIGMLVFLMALSNISTSLLRRELDMKRLQFIHVGSYVAGFGLVAIPLAASGYGTWSLIIGFSVQTAITCCAGFAATRHSLRPRLRGDSSFRRFGIKVVATNIANWAIENLDRFVIGKLWGVTPLGLYTVSFSLARAPVGMLLGSAQTVAFSSASRIQDDNERTRKGYVAMMSAFALITFPLFAVVAIEADVVMALVYGNHWAGAAPLFAALAVTTPIHGIAALSGPILWARAAVGKELQSQVFVALLLCGGLLALSGMPLATAIWVVPLAYAVRAAFLLAAVRRILEIRWQVLSRIFLSAALLATVAVVADLAIRQTGIAANDVWGGVLVIACACAAPFLLLIIVGKWLIEADLIATLVARHGQSFPIACVCRALRLRPA